MTTQQNLYQTQYSFTLISANSFDLTSIILRDFSGAGSRVLTFNSSKGTVTYTLGDDATSHTFDISSHINASNMQGITSFWITGANSQMLLAIDDIVLSNIMAPVSSKPEPTNHPTSLTATANSTSQITTSWTDSVAGSQAPDGYLLMCDKTGMAPNPVDATAQADDTSCSDSRGVQNIAHGTGTVVWTGLSAGTQYFYKIFPYTNSGGDIDYKIDGTPLTADATTDSGYSISIEKTTDASENNLGSPTDAVFTVRVTPANATGGAIIGNIAYAGTAINGIDYATGIPTFSIPNGSSIATITLDIAEDTLVEGIETIIATISNLSIGSIGTASVSANITDDESYSLAIAKTADGAENGAGSPTDAVFTVTVTPQNNTGSAITGSIAYAGTAIHGIDYATVTSFSIPNGSSTATITLDVAEDTNIEGTETAIATISNQSVGSIATATATANILDDDSYSISIEKTTDASENNLGSPTDTVFTVRVTPANTTGVAIIGNIAYAGTATNGIDYATGITTFSIPNGSSTATITLDIAEDTLAEGIETIIATISNPSVGSIATATATANILDDDSYSLSITKTTDGAENGAGSPTDAVFTVTVTPQNNTGSAITGSIAYAGTAIHGIDYATVTSFSIPNGSSTATITLDVAEDTNIEGTETAIATISNQSVGSIATATASANILDDDSYSISIEKTTDASENNLGSPTDAVFTVRVTPANTTGSAITGNISYTGTATNGIDYATGIPTFSIPNGSSIATITLDTTEDTLVEGTETIIATISSPSTGSLGTASVSANITDDESYSLAISKTSDGAENGAGSPTDAVFTVTVTPQNNTGSAITGSIAYAGTAIHGIDYATVTSFSIPNGSSTATITLDVAEDTNIEGTETAIATISNPSVGSIVTATATANILDDDSYSLSIAKTTDGAENNSGSPTDVVYTITVTPTNTTGSFITGSITYSGTATNGIDYATGTTSFSIPNNLATATITLDVSEDTDVEGTETAIATISSLSTGSIGTASATANILDDDTAPTLIPPTAGGGSSYTPPIVTPAPEEPKEEKKEIVVEPIEEKEEVKPTETKPIYIEPIARPTGNAEGTGTMPELDNVTRLYIATFGRAPESAGSIYWLYESKLNLEDIARSFFDQEETKEKYPEGFDNYDFIVSTYNHVYSREPDQAGGDYWLEELDGGKIEKGLFILAIINGAIGDDALMLRKQTIVGVNFVRSGVQNLDMAKKVIDDIN